MSIHSIPFILPMAGVLFLIHFAQHRWFPASPRGGVNRDAYEAPAYLDRRVVGEQRIQVIDSSCSIDSISM